MLVLKVLREERKSKALPSVGGDLTLLQLEYWKRAARRRRRRRENSLIVIICNKVTQVKSSPVNVHRATVPVRLMRPGVSRWGCSCTQIRGVPATTRDNSQSGTQLRTDQHRSAPTSQHYQTLTLNTDTTDHLDDTHLSLSLSLSYYRTGLTGGLRRLRILIYYRLPGT